jgi:hypothetical protein
MNMTAGATWAATANRARTCREGEGGIGKGGGQEGKGAEKGMRGGLAGPAARPSTHSAALTSFSPSPIHFDTRDDAEMEKNTAEMFVAMACGREGGRSDAQQGRTAAAKGGQAMPCSRSLPN